MRLLGAFKRWDLGFLHYGKNSKLENYFVCAFTILLAVLILIKGIFADRGSAGVEEIGLFAPIYTFAKAGKMSFPLYGYFDSFALHPPVHYFVVGWLLKIGFTIYYAEAIPIFFFSFLSFILIVKSKFLNPIKIGLSYGLYGTVILFSVLLPDSSFGCRPELHLTLAWFSSLLALESARLDNWDSKKLFLGSFLITYASGVHWAAAVAFLGLGVYVVRIYFDLGLKASIKPIANIIFGACLFGVPYLLIFVLPNIELIRYLAKVSTSCPQCTPEQNDINYNAFWIYKFFHESIENIKTYKGNLGKELVGEWFLTPLKLILQHSISPVYFAVAFLFISLQTRGIVLAALPMPLWVIFVALKKAYYFIPEFLLYLAGFGVFVSLVIVCATKITLPRSIAKLVIPIVVVVASVGIIYNSPFLETAKISLRPNFHVMDVARAMARTIVGENAIVGAAHAQWYVAGTSHYVRLESDFSVSKLPDYKQYFAKYDYLAADPGASLVTPSPDEFSLVKFYADRQLNLSGFYWLDHLSKHPALFFSTKKTSFFQGYIGLNDAYYRFQQNVDGSHYFSTFLCPGIAMDQISQGINNVHPLFFQTWAMQYPRQQRSSSFLLTLVTSNSNHSKVRNELVSYCKLREEIPGSLEVIDAYELAAKVVKTDPPIQFHKSLETAVVAQSTTTKSSDKH